MSGALVQRKPTFFWQAVLILLPVIVLTAVGGLSLRQDRILARHEAVERAQAIADELQPELMKALGLDGSARSNFPGFQTDSAGRLIFPAAYEPLPMPAPLNPKTLTPDQVALWSRWQRAGASGPESGEPASLAREFVESKPPENFAAAASYELALLQLRRRQFVEAAQMFDLVARKYPEASGESGLPLRPMAQFRLVELGAAPVKSAATNDAPPAAPFMSLDAFCSNIVYDPTPLTPYFFRALQEPAASDGTGAVSLGINESKGVADGEVIRKWERLWERHEESRRLFAAARTQLHPTATRTSPLIVDRSNTNGEAADSPGKGVEWRGVESPDDFAPRLFWFKTPEPLPVPLSSKPLSDSAPADRVNFSASADVPAVPAIADERSWLALRLNESSGRYWFTCRAESDLGSVATAVLRRNKTIPEYFGIDIELAGKKDLEFFKSELGVWHYQQLPGSKGPGGSVRDYEGGVPAPLLASSRSGGGTEWLKVMVYLTSPTTLFERQRIRAFWFGALILVSTLAALAGLTAAWRGFGQQQRLSELKSNFVSSVSHELRAPIASVRLMAENLGRGKIQEPEKQTEYFRFIVQECRRLSSLIENVLDFSRIEQGRKQYEVEPVDLLALTRETLRLMEPYATEKGVWLRLETSNVELPGGASAPERSDDGGFELTVDGRAIQQALVNLIDNAIKHSPKGETVVVELKNRAAEPAARERLKSEAGASVPRPATFCLSVSDHGPGIPAAEHEKIFERFYRLGSELRRETQGVGIGLSIVKHVVEAHGGQVIVRSDVGKGSRFTIELLMNKSEIRNPKSE